MHRPSRTVVLLLSALVLSLCVNALLIRRGRDMPKTAGTASSTGLQASNPTHARPVVEAPPQVPLLTACNQQLTTARAELSAATEALAQRTDQAVRFDEGEPAKTMEERIAPVVRKIVAKLPGVTHHDVECRGDICRVHVSAGTREEASRGWSAMTQDQTLKGLVDIFTSAAGEPVVDIASGKGGFDIDYYLNTRTAADVTAELQSSLDDFQHSGRIEQCAALAHDRGVLEVKVSVLADEARLSSAIGGSLAGTTVGACIGEALLAHLGRFSVPPGTKYGLVFATFASPHGI